VRLVIPSCKTLAPSRQAHSWLAPQKSQGSFWHIWGASLARASQAARVPSGSGLSALVPQPAHLHGDVGEPLNGSDIRVGVLGTKVLDEKVHRSGACTAKTRASGTYCLLYIFSLRLLVAMDHNREVLHLQAGIVVHGKRQS
jgi:hypothetical protein